MKRIFSFFMLAAWVMAQAGLAQAEALDKPTGGLKMNYTKIAVSNLPIGQTISMKKLVNLPLTVGNNFAVPIYVSIHFQKPAALKPGYEAIPDAGWVVPEAAGVTLAGNGQASLDVVLTIPNDEKLFGRKFQVDVVTATSGDPSERGLKLGYKIDGSLLFSIAPGRNDAELKRALSKPADAAFSFLPPRVDIWKVAAGNTVTVMADGKPVLLSNEGAKSQKYLLLAMDPKETTVTPDAGAQPGRPDDLSLERDEIGLGAGKTAPVPITIKVPASADLTKGPLFYLVSVKSGVRQGIERFIKIYLWAGEKPEKAKILK